MVGWDGEGAALTLLGISRPTLVRACGQLPLYAGTRALIEQRLGTVPDGR
jgi:hypothetical protein